MTKARDCRVRAATVALTAALGTALVAGPAAAEGLSLGVGASQTAAPGGDGATPAPPAESGAQPAPAADSPPPSTPSSARNPAHYEFGFVTAAAYQTWNLVGDVLYFGAGGGLGPPLYRYGKIGSRKATWDPTLEIAYANAFLRISPVKNIDLDFGPKIALGSALYDPDPKDTPLDKAPMSFFSYGGYVDLRVGTEKIKVGPRFEYDRLALAGFYENAWRITPLMLRVVH